MNDETRSEITETAELALVIEPDVSGPIRAESLHTSGDRATGGQRVRLEDPQEDHVPIAGQKAPHESQTANLRFRACIEAIREAREYSGDVIAHGNAVARMKETLQRLWNDRGIESVEFAQFIDLLQNAVGSTEERDLGEKQLNTLEDVFGDALHDGVDAHQVVSAMKRLQHGGFDAFSEFR